MPGQPLPKMQVQLDVSQVRSQRNTCSASAGSWNSIQARGKTRSTSGTSKTLSPAAKGSDRYRGGMRLGVLDIGSNTGHLLVVDAYRGAAPMPASSYKEELRLAEHLEKNGDVAERGIEALTEFVGNALALAEDKGCEEIYSFATSAVRDAGNCDEVLAHVEDRTGARIKVLPGDHEA